METQIIQVNDQFYELAENVREGWNEEKFIERYSEILNKYDYIVGDWGYEQLRLKGFYENNHRKSTYDSRIASLTDYIYEFCNFGCAYFVLKLVEKKEDDLASNVTTLEVNGDLENEKE